MTKHIHRVTDLHKVEPFIESGTCGCGTVFFFPIQRGDLTLSKKQQLLDRCDELYNRANNKPKEEKTMTELNHVNKPVISHLSTPPHPDIQLLPIPTRPDTKGGRVLGKWYRLNLPLLMEYVHRDGVPAAMKEWGIKPRTWDKWIETGMITGFDKLPLKHRQFKRNKQVDTPPAVIPEPSSTRKVADDLPHPPCPGTYSWEYLLGYHDCVQDIIKFISQ